MKALPVVLCLTVFCSCRQAPEEEPKVVVAVKVAKAAQENLALRVTAPATVYAREQANIASRLTAPIRALRARKGDWVKAGQVLVQLEDRDLKAQREEAVAAVADAEASLQKMSAGTLPADIERARGQVATTEAAFNQATRIYERRKQLFEQGAIPNRDLLISQTDLAQAKANYDVAKKALELLEQQSKERDIQIVRSKLEQAKGRLAYVEAQLSYTQIHSPFDGAVTEQFLFPGDMAQPNSAIFTVADLTVAVARAQVPEADAGPVKTGQPCQLSPADYPDEALAGTVTVVNQAVDPARRTVEVWCEIPNRDRTIRAGVFGQLTITVGTLPDAIVVPVAAVQFDEGTRNGTVMVVTPENKATRREVRAGPTDGARVAIVEGLSAGETVITEGGYGLPDGTAVALAGDSAKPGAVEP